jgi:AraC family transcriptional regulator
MTTTLVELSARQSPRDPAHSLLSKPLHQRILNASRPQDLASSQRKRTLPGFELLEVEYPDGPHVPEHHHANALLIYEIDGFSHAPSYLPPRAALRHTFKTGARYLVAGISAETWKRTGLPSPLDKPARVRGFAAEWLGRRLACEFYRDDALSSMALEAILLELLVELGRNFGTAATGRTVPQWLRAAREYVDSNCLRNLRLAEIATQVGVHRVHLAREFRRHYSATVGEFITRRRLEEACRLIGETAHPLAEIAIACGYSDQSHFGAVFRRNIGLTPARFRSVVRRDVMAKIPEKPVELTSGRYAGLTK